MDPVEAKVFSNGLRVRILGSLGFRPASATELAHNLSLRLDKVEYHIAVLYKTGCIVPLEGQGPGASDPVYEPVRH